MKLSQEQIEKMEQRARKAYSCQQWLDNLHQIENEKEGDYND